MKVCVLGNSVAFRIRPPRDPSRPDERTYAEWLEQYGHRVRVVATAGVLFSEAFATLDDRVVTWFPDAVVLNFGVVELALRRTPRWLNNRTIVNYYLSDVFSQSYTFETIPARLRMTVWRLLNGVVRRVNERLGVAWQWLPRDRFLEVLDRTVQVVLKETGARVILLGIAPCSDRVERILGGSVDAFREANGAMSALATRYGERVTFLSPEQYLGGGDPDELVPDGVHLSAAGHRAVAHALRRVLSGVWSAAPAAEDSRVAR